MIVRYLVTQLLKQAAQQQFRGAAASGLHESLKQFTGGIAGEAETDADERPIARADVVCLFALGIESGGCVDLLKDRISTRRGFTAHHGLLHGKPLTIVETGAGAENAARVTAEMIGRLEPRWIVSAGFAGALSEELRRGHFLMADQIVDEAGAALDVGFKITPEQLAAVKNLHVGRLLTVDRLIRTKREREQLASAHGAAACDMEAAAVARVCQERKTRFLSVRIISDGIDEELPPEIERLLMQPSVAGKAGAALGALLKRPSAVKDMWKLRDQAVESSDRLAKFLSGVVSQLPRPEAVADTEVNPS